MVCIMVFMAINAFSALFSYLFIMDMNSDGKTVRIQSVMIIYGSTQSLVGYVGGFFIAKIVYSPCNQPKQREYAFVKSDEDILD